MKFDYINRLITFTSDNIKRLLLYHKNIYIEKIIELSARQKIITWSTVSIVDGVKQKTFSASLQFHVTFISILKSKSIQW